LLEQLEIPVAVLPGDYRNIKVTTPEDLLIAAALLDMQREESA
jgi:2-C-methyl-D-erythritol 4-phosphate cytidylyltransferase